MGWVSFDRPSRHRCHPPGWFFTYFFLKAGSVWACGHCGQGYVLKRQR